MLNHIIKFFLENKLVTIIILVLIIVWGIVTAPFGWNTGILPQDPVPVDAIPNIGENQQIVFTEWPGRSPQDIEDQITYPLTSALLGIPGVKTIRSSSVFGFSSIYLIFEEDVEFYWSRSRILEKLNALPQGTLPQNVQPSLGPDATGLGQIFWYTLEGRDENGHPTGGWDLHELRSIQDFQVKYALMSSGGVSEVASIGGFVKEYQIDVIPNALKVYNVGLDKVINAIRKSNRDVGAQTIEINQAEYVVRGLGYIKKIEDIEESVITVNEHTPIRIKDIAKVSLGPAPRRGILDKSGAEVVGGVIVARHGANPLDVIENVKEKINEINPGLPGRTLADGTYSKLHIVPFYDRTQLIKETIGTLEEALSLEILITILVVIIMVLNLRASILISSLLPIAVLMCFIAMRYFHVDANIVALSGIAIAIGTMVDLGIILVENILRHLKRNQQKGEEQDSSFSVIYKATTEVSGAMLTAVMTTIISFLPVFTLQAAEGKLFRPLAFTKSFALVAAIIVALIIVPPLSHWLFSLRIKGERIRRFFNIFSVVLGVLLMIFYMILPGLVVLILGAINLIQPHFRTREKLFGNLKIGIVLFAVTYLLAESWMPLGVSQSVFLNFFFVAIIIGTLLILFGLFIKFYSNILTWCLENKTKFLVLPIFVLFMGLTIWMGFGNLFGFVATGFDKLGWNIRTTTVWSGMVHSFPGIGKEFMPALDEGSFLLMPTAMPHAGIEENKKILQMLDMAVTAIPEVDQVVGKLGRTESALDPAPISMFENVINYKSEFKTDEKGKRQRFKVDDDGLFLIKDKSDSTKLKPVHPEELPFINAALLIPDDDGQYFRQWRDHIKSPDDIWNEIVKVTRFPGVTSAPKLQPIETRLIMLQSGMRAPMGIKVKGPDLETIEAFSIQLESILKEVPSIKPEAVFADRIVGKPYLHLNIDRVAIARFGLSIEEVQRYIETSIGGVPLSMTVEGRERYPIRIRYPRELRDGPDAINNVLIPTPSGIQVPLGDLVDIEYVRGPQMIKSEDTFLLGYVLFDKRDGYAEVDVVNSAQNYIQTKIAEGSLSVPGGVSYEFAGNYENQVRAEKRLAFIVPLALLVIFMILYFQFKSIPTTLMVFSGIGVALAGGFLMIWLYGADWFMNFEFFGQNMRALFQMGAVNLSVAVWVGFIALFGIATDDGVIMATYLKQVFEKNKPNEANQIRAAVLEAGKRRVRPCLMTTATTLLALIPILTSTGRGADIMIPMAIPVFGGMTIALITLLVVPVLYAWWEETKVKLIKP
ncbi:efflux RND transporter permease subunit [Fulvivirgaceae bacterium BMA10]|uniref:Efflux RND transporter permease subunit n=1 Tax=Splendidivirga corallicola TaxID=3051826 RepID=A0ABT8KZG1_9BACT|nr:efflux RND transporter permease subunit [Fulvivirgaceae bacterium BMA10]